jgi:hypothetical protein
MNPPKISRCAALGGFAVWRAFAEGSDYKGKRDTGAKAVIDFASQIDVGGGWRFYKALTGQSPEALRAEVRAWS